MQGADRLLCPVSRPFWTQRSIPRGGMAGTPQYSQGNRSSEANTSPNVTPLVNGKAGIRTQLHRPCLCRTQIRCPFSGGEGAPCSHPRGKVVLEAYLALRPPHFRDGSSTLSPNNMGPITKCVCVCGGAEHKKRGTLLGRQEHPTEQSSVWWSAAGCVAPGLGREPAG